MSTAHLRPYSDYHYSGVEWLGEIPAHWQVRKIKNLKGSGDKSFVDGDWIELPYITSSGIRLIQTGNVGVGEYIEKGYRYINDETFQLLNCTEFRPGDVLICRLGEPVARACLAPELGHRMITSVDVCILKPSESVNSKFIVYAMSSRAYLGWVGSLVRGSTRDRVSRSMLGRFYMPVPSLPEQSAIVRYLDHANSRIQRYISAKERMIELLTEQKQAITNQAVTRGLDPNVPLKPSGVEWLGDVPAHWDTVRNGRLFTQRNETGFADLPILEVSLRTGVTVRRFGASGRKQMMSVRSDYKRAAQGDITYNMMRMWQGAVGVAPVDGLVSPAYVIAKPLQGTNPFYFSALFRTREYMAEVDKRSRGIVKDRNRLYWEDFKQIPTPCPPFEEQSGIVEYLRKATAESDSAIDRAHRQIDLMQEYRTRLIADVVTGKLDVRRAEYLSA